MSISINGQLVDQLVLEDSRWHLLQTRPKSALNYASTHPGVLQQVTLGCSVS